MNLRTFEKKLTAIRQEYEQVTKGQNSKESLDLLQLHLIESKATFESSKTMGPAFLNMGYASLAFFAFALLGNVVSGYPLSLWVLLLMFVPCALFLGTGIFYRRKVLDRSFRITVLSDMVKVCDNKSYSPITSKPL